MSNSRVTDEKKNYKLRKSQTRKYRERVENHKTKCLRLNPAVVYESRLVFSQAARVCRRTTVNDANALTNARPTDPVHVEWTTPGTWCEGGKRFSPDEKSSFPRRQVRHAPPKRTARNATRGRGTDGVTSTALTFTRPTAHDRRLPAPARDDAGHTTGLLRRDRCPPPSPGRRHNVARANERPRYTSGGQRATPAARDYFGGDFRTAVLACARDTRTDADTPSVTWRDRGTRAARPKRTGKLTSDAASGSGKTAARHVTSVFFFRRPRPPSTAVAPPPGPARPPQTTVPGARFFTARSHDRQPYASVVFRFFNFSYRVSSPCSPRTLSQFPTNPQRLQAEYGS